MKIRKMYKARKFTGSLLRVYLVVATSKVEASNILNERFRLEGKERFTFEDMEWIRDGVCVI